jgi:hypothetical protein
MFIKFGFFQIIYKSKSIFILLIKYNEFYII